MGKLKSDATRGTGDKRGSAIIERHASRLEYNLDAVVVFLVEDVVPVRRFRERQAVRDDVVELNLALLDPPDQLVDVALRRALAETHFDAFVENLAERKVIVGHTVDAASVTQPPRRTALIAVRSA